MSGSLTRGREENVPGIPGACATHRFRYLVRGPWDTFECLNFHALISRPHSKSNRRGLQTLFQTTKSRCMQKNSPVDALLTTQNVLSWAMHWEMAFLSYLLYGCVDNLHICLRISKVVAHLTAKRAYFVLSAMVVTDSPGTGQMIVTALQGDRNCHMWIVTDWICQDWSNGNYWIHASQSLHKNAFQTSSMCSYVLVRNIGLCTSLHTMNNRQRTSMNNMTILTYYWIGPFMSW